MLQRAPAEIGFHPVKSIHFQPTYHKTQVPDQRDAILFYKFNPTLIELEHLIEINRGYTDHNKHNEIKAKQFRKHYKKMKTRKK